MELGLVDPHQGERQDSGTRLLGFRNIRAYERPRCSQVARSELIAVVVLRCVGYTAKMHQFGAKEARGGPKLASVSFVAKNFLERPKKTKRRQKEHPVGLPSIVLESKEPGTGATGR